MTFRYCDGGAAAGKGLGGSPCRCGLMFDDTMRDVWIPHDFLANQHQVAWTSASPAMNAASVDMNVRSWTLHPGKTIVMPSGIPPVPSAPIPPEPVPASLEDTEEAARRLAEQVAVPLKEGDRVAVVVAPWTSSREMDVIAGTLGLHGVEGIIVRASAMSDAPPAVSVTTREQRVSVLARLGQLWEKHPELSLSQLSRGWETSGDMDDEMFLAAAAAYLKIWEGK